MTTPPANRALAVSEITHGEFYLADLIFVICESTAKIGSLKNLRLYGTTCHLCDFVDKDWTWDWPSYEAAYFKYLHACTTTPSWLCQSYWDKSKQIMAHLLRRLKQSSTNAMAITDTWTPVWVFWAEITNADLLYSPTSQLATHNSHLHSSTSSFHINIYPEF